MLQGYFEFLAGHKARQQGFNLVDAHVSGVIGPIGSAFQPHPPGLIREKLPKSPVDIYMIWLWHAER